MKDGRSQCLVGNSFFRGFRFELEESSLGQAEIDVFGFGQGSLGCLYQSFYNGFLVRNALPLSLFEGGEQFLFFLCEFKVLLAHYFLGSIK